MDLGTFETIEKVHSPKGPDRVEYWHGSADSGECKSDRQLPKQYRIDATVHDSSTLCIRGEENASVEINYRMRDSSNIYVTGNGLWPRAGSSNPAMTIVGLAMDLANNLVPERR